MTGLFTQAGESRLIVGVDGLVLLATAAATTELTTTGSTATELTARSTAATATGTVTTTTATVTAGSTTATATATPGALRLLMEAVVDLQEGLGLALTLTLGLATGAGEKLLLLVLLGDRGEILPLVILHALVGLADLELGGKGSLLLGELGKVLVVGEMLRLRLLLLGFAFSSTLAFGLLLGLGNLSAGLLVLQLGLALVGAPRLGSLLLGVAASVGVNTLSINDQGEEPGVKYNQAYWIALRDW